MLNTLVSIKSYIGSLIIFISFIVSFVTMIATYDQPNIKFMLFPLVISLGIAVLNSIVYMNDIIKMKEGEYENDVRIKLNSCPEYWVKDVMYTNTNQRVNVCKNYFKDEKDKMSYVGGSAKNTGKFHDNFKGTSESNLGETLSNMNAINGRNPIATTEPFTQPSIYEAENSGDPNSEQKVRYEGDESIENSEVPLSDIDGKHYHYISSMETHSNNDDVDGTHSQIIGKAWHWHGGSTNPLSASRIISDDCSNKWICSKQDGIIINMDQLNAYSNNQICDQAEKFYWVEARNKCTANNI